MSAEESSSTSTEIIIKRLHVGNLGANVLTDDLIQLFGLGKTEFLQKTSTVELITWTNNGASKNYAYLNVPADIVEELMKLNGIEYFGRKVSVEECDDISAAKITLETPKGKGAKKGQYKTPTRSPAGGRGRGRGGRGRGSPSYRGRGGGARTPQRWQRYKNRFNVETVEADQMFNLVDCGVNLTNPKFFNNADQAIARALAAGVQKFVVTGLRFVGSRRAIIMSISHPNVLYAAVGVHPHFVKLDWNEEKTADQLEEMIKLPEVVAVGECGLDFNRNFSPAEQQISAFKKQVALAVKYQKPLLVHDRDSHEGILDVLKEFADNLPPVVIHCFTGTVEHIKAYVEKGFYVGVTGFVCKEKYGAHVRAAIKDGSLPLSRVVLQSNAPYMIPNMKQDEMDPVSKMLIDECYVDNEPCTLSIVVRCIAKCLSIEPKKVADQCNETANNVFHFHKVGTDFE